VVDFKKQCMEEGAYYRQAIRLATLELNALVAGALEGGAEEVYAWPGHGAFPGGLDVEHLHPECRLVMYAGDAGPAGYDGSFDAMLLHGLHGMAGSEGVLAHSFMPFIENIWLNDLRIGEIAMNMAVFGVHGVPTVFVSGDQAAADEATALVPGVEAAVVKWALEEKERLGALSVRKAVSLSPAKAQETVRDAARRAMNKVGSVEPFRLDPPYTMKVEYTDEKYAEMALRSPGVKRIGEATTNQTRNSLHELVF
jgi:D-amino peptidase